MKLVAWDRSYLTELVGFWNQELAADFPMREELFVQNSFDDVNVSEEGSAVAVDDAGKVIGFVVAKQWQEDVDIEMNAKRGWIQALLVSSQHRDKGIGSALLAHAEGSLKANGIEQIQLAGDPWHYFPGIPDQFAEAQRWAEQKGYEKRVDTYDLINHTDKMYALPQADGVEFSLLQKGEEQELLAFIQRCFPGRWEYETMKYFGLGGNGREYVVVKKNNQVIGFCRINDADSPFIAQNVYWAPLFEQEIGGIGPLGIDPDEQKQGYGLAVVQAAVAYLQQRNIKTLVIDWTNFLDFYGKLDFEPWKKYGVYLKDLS